MEEAVGASGDGLVAIDTSWADDTNGRLVRLHVVSLVVRGMRAKDDVLGHLVGVGLDEEGVLHVAGRMVGGEVQLGEYMQVVVNLRAFGQGESHALEDVHDLILHDVERMACSEGDGIGSAREVDVVADGVGSLKLLLEFVDFLECLLLQFVDLDSNGLLFFSGHVAEVGHKGVDLALLAEIFQSELFDFLSILCRKSAYFFEKFVYFV